jgi:hypothetical protein
MTFMSLQAKTIFSPYESETQGELCKTGFREIFSCFRLLPARLCKAEDFVFVFAYQIPIAMSAFSVESRSKKKPAGWISSKRFTFRVNLGKQIWAAVLDVIRIRENKAR